MLRGCWPCVRGTLAVAAKKPSVLGSEGSEGTCAVCLLAVAAKKPGVLGSEGLGSEGCKGAEACTLGVRKGWVLGSRISEGAWLVRSLGARKGGAFCGCCRSPGGEVGEVGRVP